MTTTLVSVDRTPWLVDAARMMDDAGFPASPDQLSRLMTNGFKIAWQAECYTYMYVVLGHQAYISNFVVHPACRGKGLGPRLVHALFAVLKASGVTHVYAETNRRGWLRALGMTPMDFGRWAVKEL